MPNASLSFDHVHLVAKDPHATAAWYVEKLCGEVTRTADVKGAPQVYVALGGFIVIVRGQRPAESVKDKPGLEWGVDHFGLRVRDDFDGFCTSLKGKGVKNVQGYGWGDLHVRVTVEVPAKLTAEQRAKLQEFADSCGRDVNPKSQGFFEKAKNLFR